MTRLLSDDLFICSECGHAFHFDCYSTSFTCPQCQVTYFNTEGNIITEIKKERDEEVLRLENQAIVDYLKRMHDETLKFMLHLKTISIEDLDHLGDFLGYNGMNADAYNEMLIDLLKTEVEIIDSFLQEVER